VGQGCLPTRPRETVACGQHNPLAPAELVGLARTLLPLCRSAQAPLLVNSRLEVVKAARADGIHLPADGSSVANARRMLGPGALIARSCHSPEEVAQAAREGADFAVFGPMFPSSSKEGYGPPLGVGKLSEAARELAPFPLLALGGISFANMNECLLAGANGIAGITLFTEPEAFATTVEAISESSKN